MTSFNIYDYVNQSQIDKFAPTYLYIKQHQVTGKLYFGKTRKRDVVKYSGSGTVWKRHLRAHGNYVDTLWYCLFTDINTLVETAVTLSQLLDVVQSSDYANLLTETGVCGWYPGSAQYNMLDGSSRVLFHTDPQIHKLGLRKTATGRGLYKNAETGEYVSKRPDQLITERLVGFHTGKAVYRDQRGGTFSCSTNDPRIATGELVHMNAGTAMYTDATGRTIRCRVDDLRIAQGELISPLTGTAAFVDVFGNHHRVPVNDPRVLSGELVGVAKRTGMYKDKFGNVVRLTLTDPRVLSGEVVGVRTGTGKTGRYADKTGRIIRVRHIDSRVLTGQLIPV